ncbi:MAG: branched-chain amino acid ABC transporter permease [Candidatus Lambdaproteobacteria bacterium]|nr:branched-chain amino acid ABC transporter permease [Candidatus Lambdaproteobacteria bacterium]
MNWLLLFEQTLNGFQLGTLLFLLAAGLTLIFGIMDLVNLAHGSLFMMGAFFCASLADWTGSFLFGALLAVPAAIALGIVVELVALRTLYDRNHLDQVLATFGLILFFNEAVRIVWGSAGRAIPLPALLKTHVQILGIPYPTYRIMTISIGLLVALGLYVLIARTRLGMLIRAGATNREMVGALGVDIRLLYTLVFGLGAGLAGLAGLLTATVQTAEIGMGEHILIPSFVVIVIGGIGSIRGSFVAAIIVGLIDTLGRSYIPDLLKLFFSELVASTAAPALSSMMIYLIMAIVLVLRPQGLFPAHAG